MRDTIEWMMRRHRPYRWDIRPRGSTVVGAIKSSEANGEGRGKERVRRLTSPWTKVEENEIYSRDNVL